VEFGSKSGHSYEKPRRLDEEKREPRGKKERKHKNVCSLRICRKVGGEDKHIDVIPRSQDYNSEANPYRLGFNPVIIAPKRPRVRRTGINNASHPREINLPVR